jgi:hypothetical protein
MAASFGMSRDELLGFIERKETKLRLRKETQRA